MQPVDYLAKGGFMHNGINSYEIVCSPLETYTKAFACLIDSSAGGRVSCAEYVNYLIDHFGAYMHCARHDGYKVSVKLPPGEQMKELIASLGYGSSLASFEKGLSSN